MNSWMSFTLGDPCARQVYQSAKRGASSFVATRQVYKKTRKLFGSIGFVNLFSLVSNTLSIPWETETYLSVGCSPGFAYSHDAAPTL